MPSTWLTTGEAATLLGVSRQHVVNMCERREVTCSRAGSHRRVLRDDVMALVPRNLTREEAKSLWLHQAMLGALMLDPDGVRELARQNIDAWLPRHRPDGMAATYLREWARLLDGDMRNLIAVLTSTNERSCELRQNSPFAGVLTDASRQQALKAFRTHWQHDRPAA